MADAMTFPKTVDEFMEQYKIVDVEEVYTNGAELVPIFRMKQWFEHSEKHGRWVPVSERLPKQGQEVICQCRARIIKVLKLDADGDWYQDASHCYMRGFVIAWMPLPEPYKEGEAHETD